MVERGGVGRIGAVEIVVQDRCDVAAAIEAADEQAHDAFSLPRLQRVLAAVKESLELTHDFRTRKREIGFQFFERDEGAGDGLPKARRVTPVSLATLATDGGVFQFVPRVDAELGRVVVGLKRGRAVGRRQACAFRWVHAVGSFPGAGGAIGLEPAPRVGFSSRPRFW